ncbi:Hypp2607 [Branchiostoma lanceolatum]|uniref:Hypp2607 protein n=1 Tax=Branchiostoma lanceolatum TaxID=7740 RepID=A0A8J9ZVW7_BRALA|nr:Hypp2607 [Branchiostoma lanceolatum]
MDDRQSAIRRYCLCRCCIVVPVLLAVFCAVGIIFCGVFVVKPVVSTGSLDYKETVCTTTSATFLGPLQKCVSCVNCNNPNLLYPCLVIEARYNQGSSGILYETEARQIFGEVYAMDDRQSAIRRYCLCRCCIVVPVLLAVFCAVGIIFCGVFVVKPVVSTGSLDYKETVCTTTSATFLGPLQKCVSCVNCNNPNLLYPCLVIEARYNQGSSGILYETEARLDSSIDLGSACATSPTCKRDNAYTREIVLRFAREYGAGNTYKCLFRPGSNKLLLRRQFTQQSMIHSMLWTSVGLVLFVGVTVYMCCQCKKARDQVMTMAGPGASPESSAPPYVIGLYPMRPSMNNPYTHPLNQNPAALPGNYVLSAPPAYAAP